MKVLFVGLKLENYGSQNGRFSFEYVNFFRSLRNMKEIEVIEYPFDNIIETGRKKWNEGMINLVVREKPNLLFAFMYTDEIDIATLKSIRSNTQAKTIAWFADDYWRFWNYSKNWAPYFDWVVTTSHQALGWYNQKGIKNVILSQWACNTCDYKPLNFQKDIDVSFVGQYKSGRAKILKELSKLGISVETYGFGWPNGKVDHEKMLEIFSRSKISLNINARPSSLQPKVIARIFLKKSINKVKLDFHILDNLKAYLHFKIHHIHARPFELAGCKSFVISGYSEGIDQYYKEGKEMIFYYSIRDLADKIKYYLQHPEIREEIATAGYNRTIGEHTYENRFREIFRKIGMNF